MTTCAKCVRPLAGDEDEQARCTNTEACDLRAELRDLRAAVLAIAAEMTHEDRHVRHGAWAVRLRESCCNAEVADESLVDALDAKGGAK